jgi:hypothetical protein
VNEAAHRVRGHHPQKPQHDQDQGDRREHRSLSFASGWQAT